MIKTFITLSITFLVAFTAFGQSVTVSSSNAAIIEVNTTNKGIFIPRVTTAQTDLIFVTRATGTGRGTGTSYYAKWDGAVWEIRREYNGTITGGTNINVLVIKQ
ncbi:hypothetical protein DR864_22925 [Runella rosea]|uniref:Uncharacterized protein n=1 Tax=Runella rosea TaxID=2259595 RepID=A0A344TP21_9BACT|nr:hypothetical protein [Runella rosea]AXE20392.1 hypothetical protein DR864_22925 [Runella rosea]